MLVNLAAQGPASHEPSDWAFRQAWCIFFCWPGDGMSLGHWNLDVGGLVKQLQLKDATHRDAFFPTISSRAATSQGLKHDYHIWFILIPFVSFWLNWERKLRTYEISYFFLMLLLQAYPVSCRVPEKTAPFRYQRIISEMRWYREIQWGMPKISKKLFSEYAFRKWSIVLLHLAGLVQTGSVSQGNGFCPDGLPKFHVHTNLCPVQYVSALDLTFGLTELYDWNIPHFIDIWHLLTVIAKTRTMHLFTSDFLSIYKNGIRSSSTMKLYMNIII